MFWKVKTTKEDRLEARRFLKTFGIRLHFTKYGWSSAYCTDRLIEIDYREADSVQRLWSTVFHELSHILCYDQGLYEIYHHENVNEEYLNWYVRRYGLRAEKFVDKKAEELMNIYLPDIPFQGCYNTEADSIWYKRWVEKNYPE